MKFDYQLRVEGILNRIVPRETNPKGFKLIDSRKVPTGYEFAYRIPNGYAFADIERQADALRAACGCTVELEDRAGVILIKVYYVDFPSSIAYKEKDLTLTQGPEVLIGFNRVLNPVTHHFKIPHLLIAGQSGYGKTDLLRWIIYQLVTRFTPDELCIHIIDLKGFSFLPFKDIPHITIHDTLDEAKTILKESRQLMNERKEIIKEANNRKIIDSFKWHIVVIDEASQIAPVIEPDKETRVKKQKCDKYIADIAQIGREPKIGLIYCTQRPDANVINPLVKANVDAKIGFRVATQTNSFVILDQEGAENLPYRTPGRCLYLTDVLTEIQVPYIGDDDKWDELIKPLRKVRVKHDNETRTTQDPNPQNDEGPSNRLDGSSLDAFLGEWESVETGLGDHESIGESEASGGETTRDREDQNMATYIRWTFPPPIKTAAHSPDELPQSRTHPKHRGGVD